MGIFDLNNKSRRVGRFINRNLPDFSGTNNEIDQKHKSLITYDEQGSPLCVPLILEHKEELRVFGFDGFNRNFKSVSSLIAYPGQGKSRLATAIYNQMRGTNRDYFKTSDSAISFTRGVWRLADADKRKHVANDQIDILDVEGLQKENAVYYLLIGVVVLSQSMVLLSRERVNKDALGVLEIAFKILGRLGIALRKPTLFIQTKIGPNGVMLDGERKPTTKEKVIDEIAEHIPIIREFQIEFFGLTEVPNLDVLFSSEIDGTVPEGIAQKVYQSANKKYDDDVKTLISRLKQVKDEVPAEARMHYLLAVLDHLNDKNPDLVLEQNLDFFAKDAQRWIDTAVSMEKDELIFKHRVKPIGDAQSIERLLRASSERSPDQMP